MQSHRVGVETLYDLCFASLRRMSVKGFSYRQVECIIRTKSSSIIIFENVLIRHLIEYSSQLNVNIDHIWRQLNYLLFHHCSSVNHYDMNDDPCTEFVNNYFQNAVHQYLHSKSSGSKMNILDLTLFHIYEIFSNELDKCFDRAQWILLSSLSLANFPLQWSSYLKHLTLSENFLTHYLSDQFFNHIIDSYLIPNACSVSLNMISSHDILWKCFVKNKATRLQLYRCNDNTLYNLMKLCHEDYCEQNEKSKSTENLNSSPDHICNNNTEVYLCNHGSKLVHSIEEIILDISHISDFQKRKETSRIYINLFRFLYNIKKITLKYFFIDHQNLQLFQSLAESFRLKYFSIENSIIQPNQSPIITDTNGLHFSGKNRAFSTKHLLFTPLTAFEDTLWYLTILRLHNVKVHERVQKVVNPNELLVRKSKATIFSIIPSISMHTDNKHIKLTYHLTRNQAMPLSFCFQSPLISIFGPNALRFTRRVHHQQQQQKEIASSNEKLQQQLIIDMTNIMKHNEKPFPSSVLPQAKFKAKRHIRNTKQLITPNKPTISINQTPVLTAKTNPKRIKSKSPSLMHHADTVSKNSSKTISVSSISPSEPVIHRVIYKHLCVLDLSSTQIETADYLRLIYVMEHAPFIEKIDFSRWNEVVDFVPIFNTITKHCSNIKWINLEGTTLTQSSIVSLISLFKARSTTLIHINLKQTHLSLPPNDLLTEFIDSLHQCTLLQHLNLSNNSLSDSFLLEFLTQHYCQNVQHLRFLDIRQNKSITLDTIFHIVNRLYKHPISTLLYCGLITTYNTTKEQRQVLIRHGTNTMIRSMFYQYH